MGVLFPKPRPRKLEKADRAKARKKADQAENAKVKARSGGRCEALECFASELSMAVFRCTRHATQIHHMIGGWGKRARGNSILAEHKQHVCDSCHPLITGRVLQRIGEPVPQWTDRYLRVR